MNALDFTLPALEPRLQARCQQLVQQQMHPSQTIAAGIKALPGVSSAFASTQAAWRFYNNPSILLPDLAKPLIEHGRRAIAEDCNQYGLLVHDWSALTYLTHPSKKDRKTVQGCPNLGYELQSALLLSDRTGAPLSCLAQDLASKSGVYSTCSAQVLPDSSRQNQMTQKMRYLANLGLGRPLVHIGDREYDSVGHYRRWVREKRLFLIRAKIKRRVQCQGQDVLLSELVGSLPLRFCRQVEYKGKKALQYVGEVEVVLKRGAQPKQAIRGKRHEIAGPPVRLRLIISQVRLESGRVLANWVLLSNVPKDVSAEQIALWYYWRWRVESFFKLLKSAGHHVEEWQQRNALAVARRLLVTSMACVLVWQLARQESPQAEGLRDFLIRLSGRQMKRKQPCTISALLEGVWALLAVLDALEHDDGTQVVNFLTLFKSLLTPATS